ncbi:MAG TPA: hypothetical protein VFO35_20890 [Steroidobacteraceae bacterium]|nr:hypothetical protein [Steroidobacteraceae bacterium]
MISKPMRVLAGIACVIAHNPAKTASVYTGIVGVIIGYYFGRSIKSEDAATQK